VISIFDRPAFQILTSYRRKVFAKLLQAVILVAFFSIFIHLTTSESLSSRTLSGSACLVAVAAALSSRRFGRARESARPLWALLSALAGGFWLFSLFRFMGLVEWPLGRAADFAGYSRLFYFHFILSVSVLTPVVVTGNITALRQVSWGSWQSGASSISLRTALSLSVLAVWIWAFLEVLSLKPHASGPIMGLVVISLLKAALTGATEEICFRGLIQPAAIARFGVPLGIALQGCLYTAYHMHLDAAFFSRPGFLAGVMGLGLMFGAITRLSRGIGWAFVIHMGVNLVIEWHNLS